MPLGRASDTAAAPAAPQTDEHAIALVREYLGRKGYKRALAALDAERPRSQADITSRGAIVSELRLDRRVRLNRQRSPPLATLLEVVVDARLQGEEEKASDESQGGGGAAAAKASPAPPTSLSGAPPPSLCVSLPPGGPLGPSAPAAAPAAPSVAAPAAAPASTATSTAGAAAAAGAKTRIGQRATKDAGYRVTFSELPDKPAAAGGTGDASPPSGAAPLSVSGKRGETIVARPGEVCGHACDLADLVECTVLLLDWTSQITIDNCVRCKMLLGPCDGSLMLRSCSQLTLSAACRQFRARDCADVASSLFTAGPIIESSSRMRFGPWNASYPKAASHFAAAKLQPPHGNNWSGVFDFNDADGALSPPNWSLLPQAEWKVWEVAVPGASAAEYGPCENPAPLPTATPARGAPREPTAAIGAAAAPAASAPAAAAPAVPLSAKARGKQPMTAAMTAAEVAAALSAEVAALKAATAQPLPRSPPLPAQPPPTAQLPARPAAQPPPPPTAQPPPSLVSGAAERPAAASRPRPVRPKSAKAKGERTGHALSAASLAFLELGTAEGAAALGLSGERAPGAAVVPAPARGVARGVTRPGGARRRRPDDMESSSSSDAMGLEDGVVNIEDDLEESDL